MILVEKHQLPYNSKLDELCFLSKNVYNSTLYAIRQEFTLTGKFKTYPKLAKEFVITKNKDYYALPTKVSQQTMKMAEQNFKSFFKSNQSYKKNPKKFKGKPKIPNYKNSITGRFMLIYTNQAISKKEFKKGFISLSQTELKIKTKIRDWDSIKQVRIIPKSDYFVIEVVHSKQSKPKIISNHFSAIDLGLNNLATISYSDGQNPIIINGKPLKSINQFYNKRKAQFQSKLKNNKTSKKINKLSNKRNNKINDYLHKSSRFLVNQLVSKNISKLIIGYNKQWKQDINIGKRNNQNFVNIPFYKFIFMLKYKCELEGVEVILNEESYTSKCSFLDLEDVRKHEKYKGRRTKRGLFISSKNKLINADLNGSYNIMRKVVPNVFTNGIEDVVVHPRLVTI